LAVVAQCSSFFRDRAVEKDFGYGSDNQYFSRY